MTTYIIAALLLALLQTWLIPASFNMKNFPWLGSNRDEPMPHELTIMAGRAMRANTNLQETLPIFLALALLSMQLSVDVTGLACWWLAFRVGACCYIHCWLCKGQNIALAWLNCVLSDDGTGINLEQF